MGATKMLSIYSHNQLSSLYMAIDACETQTPDKLHGRIKG